VEESDQLCVSAALNTRKKPSYSHFVGHPVKSRTGPEAVDHQCHYCFFLMLLRSVRTRKIKTGIFVKVNMDDLKVIEMVG